MSLSDFTSVEHALVSPSGVLSTGVDDKLEVLGLKRQVAIASSNFLTIKSLIHGRQLLCIVPKLVARQEGSCSNLKAVTPPIEVPDFDIQLVYRKGKQRDDKNIFIRRLISQVVVDIAGQSSPGE